MHPFACRKLASSVIRDFGLMSLILAVPSSAGAQANSTDKVLRFIVSQFTGVGGYWFTDATATRALGTPKFGGDSTYYVKPAHRYGVAITGGVEVVSASDHWLPFSGGNSFSLTGASVQISGDRGHIGRLTPYFRLGLFAGNVHSEQENFDSTSFVPSAGIGLELKVQRYVVLSARYRISGEVHGVNTDGFNLGLRVF